MTDQFTPGEWRTNLLDNGKSNAVQAVTHGPHCSIYEPVVILSRTTEFSQNDLRLISAAKELLEACGKLLEDRECFCEETGTCCVCLGKLAISKATGAKT